jgi:aminoglycoside 3-N-acetyltransferase I
LRALNVLFGRAFSDPETYGAAPPTDAYLETILGREHVIALVALEGEEVLGGFGGAQGWGAGKTRPHNPFSAEAAFQSALAGAGLTCALS